MLPRPHPTNKYIYAPTPYTHLFSEYAPFLVHLIIFFNDVVCILFRHLSLAINLSLLCLLNMLRKFNQFNSLTLFALDIIRSSFREARLPHKHATRPSNLMFFFEREAFETCDRDILNVTIDKWCLVQTVFDSQSKNHCRQCWCCADERIWQGNLHHSFNELDAVERRAELLRL